MHSAKMSDDHIVESDAKGLLVSSDQSQALVGPGGCVGASRACVLTTAARGSSLKCGPLLHVIRHLSPRFLSSLWAVW